MFSNLQLIDSDLPNINTVTFTPLAKNALKEVLLSTYAVLIPITLVCILLVYVVIELPPFMRVSVIFGSFILNGMVAIYITLAIKNTAYALRTHDFLIQKGVFWKKTTVVPFVRIQHIESHRNPFERWLNLASLKLFTAGGMGADLSISGLTFDKAQQIRQVILNQERSTNNE